MSVTGTSSSGLTYCQAASGVKPVISEEEEELRVVVTEVDDDTGEENILLDEAISAFMRNEDEEEDDDEIEIRTATTWVSITDPTLRQFALHYSHSPIYLLAYVENLAGDGFDVSVSTNDTKFDDGETAFWREKAPGLENRLHRFLTRLGKTPETLTPCTPVSIEPEILATLIRSPALVKELLTSESERSDAYLKSMRSRESDGTVLVEVPKIIYEDFLSNGPRQQCLSIDSHGKLFVVPTNELEEMLRERGEEYYPHQAQNRTIVLDTMLETQMEILKCMADDNVEETASSSAQKPLTKNQKRRRRKKATSVVG